ncbi:divergent PAP2 family protein [Paenibacillus humicola]|uniref:divergent PAP2 family protein n=1 Tax=Paenibacillus humicola TaxID=3110540 RepID=UPI00237BB899|nr:divergent PAP2 family protein [Paenibacillus humicola]
MGIFFNFPLMAALVAVVAAQAIKIPLYWITNKKLTIGLGFSTGGMPSSHSAAVCSLASAVGMQEGLASDSFAIAVVFSIITMYDAAGIRRHAGLHAAILNRIGKTMSKPEQGTEESWPLKELLGHRPIEVFAGALFGIAVALVLRVSIFS